MNEQKECKNNACDFHPILNREAQARTPEQIQYGKLWAEVELPELLEAKPSESPQPKTQTENNNNHNNKTGDELASTRPNYHPKRKGRVKTLPFITSPTIPGNTLIQNSVHMEVGQ